MSLLIIGIVLIALSLGALSLRALTWRIRLVLAGIGVAGIVLVVASTRTPAAASEQARRVRDMCQNMATTLDVLPVEFENPLFTDMDRVNRWSALNAGLRDAASVCIRDASSCGAVQTRMPFQPHFKEGVATLANAFRTGEPCRKH